MRELIKPVLFLILLIPFATVTNAYAFTCGNTECVAGEYCTNYGADNALTCLLCKSLYPQGEYPYSDVDDDPTKGTGVCYKICEEIEITNGKWAPAEDKAYYNSACEYDLECDGLEDYCGGFHPDDQNKSCGHGFKYWMFSTTAGTGTYVNNGQCFLTACNEGYHLLVNATNDCGDTYGECVSNTAECASLLKNCDGTITGNAEWNDAGWDYDNCRCETDNARIDNGFGARSCPWDSDEGDWSTDCETDVTACDVGYCEHKNNLGSCAAARPGWYHDNDTSAECQPCPAGMTSDGTDKESNKIADSIEKCGMRTGPEGTRFCDREGTRFCDSHGCFTLPGNGELIYYKAW